jgi:hypothetical protein
VLALADEAETAGADRLIGHDGDPAEVIEAEPLYLGE